MSKRKTILWLGIATAVMPFLGFPSLWKTVFYLAAGTLIAYNAYQVGKHTRVRESRTSRKAKRAAVAEEAASAPAPAEPVAPSVFVTEEEIKQG